ncbi:hypothetical protein ABH923_001192 [Leifsonia sp. EB41]
MGVVASTPSDVDATSIPHNGSSGTYLPVKETKENGYCHV